MTKPRADLRLRKALQQIRKHPLLLSLSDSQFKELSGSARFVELQSEEILFIQNADAQRFFIILNGNIKLFRLTSEGREIVMNVLGPNSAVGEAAMFMESHHYPVNASAIEGGQMLSLSSETYQRLLMKSSESCFGVLSAIAGRLESSLVEIETLTLKSASHRVIRFLLSLVEGSTDQEDIKLPVAKQLIAARLAMQPETFSRVMNDLKKRDLLSVRGCHLTILSVSKLKELIQ